MSFYLLFELIGIIGKRSQRVGISLCQKLYTTGLGEFLERAYHLRCVHFELVDSTSCDGKSYFELAFVFIDKLQEQGVSRQIAMLSQIFKLRAIGVIIEVIMFLADVEELILSKTFGVMDLEIDTNWLFHRWLFYIKDS